MKTAQNLGIQLSKDELIALRSQGQERRQVALANANSKGRKLGYLGVEYTQRQRSNYLANVSSEDIAAALHAAGKLTIFKRQSDNAVCFAWVNEKGEAPDSFDNLPVAQVEEIVRAFVEGDEMPTTKGKKKPPQAK